MAVDHTQIEISVQCACKIQGSRVAVLHLPCEVEGKAAFPPWRCCASECIGGRGGEWHVDRCWSGERGSGVPQCTDHAYRRRNIMRDFSVKVRDFSIKVGPFLCYVGNTAGAAALTSLR